MTLLAVLQVSSSTLPPQPQCTNVSLRLISQDSRSPCTLGAKYGCHEDGEWMWVRSCRGTFRCGDGPEVPCGFPPGQPSYHCRCDGQGDLAPGWAPNSGSYFLTPMPSYHCRCDGGCACSETRMDTLIDQQVTVTRFMRLRTTVSSPAPAAVSRLDPEIPTFLPSHWIRKFRHSCPLSKCTVLVSNSHSRKEPHRVVLRAVIVGPLGRHTQFVDPFHLNTIEWA